MNVLIETLSIRKEKAGVGVYAKNLVECLLASPNAANIHFFLLCHDDDPDFAHRAANVTLIRLPAHLFRKLPLRFAYEQLILPFVLLRHRIDVIHSLHYSFPLLRFGTRQVVTIHDMTSYLLPDVHERIKIVYFRFFIRVARRLADATIFVSASAQRDCIRLLGPMHHASAVVPLGKSDAFRPVLDPERLRAVRAKYKLPGRFLLYIGTIEPRKNLDALLAAFAAIAPEFPDLGLVLAGGRGWKNALENLQAAIARQGLVQRVVFPGFVDEDDKATLLSTAEVFVYPSLYEGFGLPVLEAMACGVPVVTSNLSSIPEVAGNGAWLIDPTNTPELTSAIRGLLSDSTLRSDLAQRALRQAAKFTWQATAEKTLAMYRDRP